MSSCPVARLILTSRLTRLVVEAGEVATDEQVVPVRGRLHGVDRAVDQVREAGHRTGVRVEREEVAAGVGRGARRVRHPVELAAGVHRGADLAQLADPGLGHHRVVDHARRVLSALTCGREGIVVPACAGASPTASGAITTSAINSVSARVRQAWFPEIMTCLPRRGCGATPPMNFQCAPAPRGVSTLNLAAVENVARCPRTLRGHLVPAWPVERQSRPSSCYLVQVRT